MCAYFCEGEKYEGLHVQPLMQRMESDYLFSQAVWQESATQQESTTQQVSALQQESAATHSVLALSHVVSFDLLLQHELMVRAATATIANNTFFIIFFFFLLSLTIKNMGAKIQTFSYTLLFLALYFKKNV